MNKSVIATVVIILVLIAAGVVVYATQKNNLAVMLGQNPQPSATTMAAVTPPTNTPSSSGQPKYGGRGGQRQLPAGAKPIFGTITAVNGSQLTLKTQSRNGASGTLTVDISSSTQFKGGTQSSLQTNTRIAGYGTANSDGSINAEQININPQFGNRSYGSPSPS